MERKFFEVKLDVSTVKVLSTALHLLQKIGKDAIIGKQHLLSTVSKLLVVE